MKGDAVEDKIIKCPNCKSINVVPYEEYKDIEIVGKAVIECNTCHRWFLLRDDGDGEYVCS